MPHSSVLHSPNRSLGRGAKCGAQSPDLLALSSFGLKPSSSSSRVRAYLPGSNRSRHSSSSSRHSRAPPSLERKQTEQHRPAAASSAAHFSEYRGAVRSVVQPDGSGRWLLDTGDGNSATAQQQSSAVQPVRCSRREVSEAGEPLYPPSGYTPGSFSLDCQPPIASFSLDCQQPRGVLERRGVRGVKGKISSNSSFMHNIDRY